MAWMNMRLAGCGVVLALIGCGGSGGAPPAADQALVRTTASSEAAATGPSLRGARRRALVLGPDDPLDAGAVFDWAEWKYPELFPAGPGDVGVDYLGVHYTVRAYATENYLGITDDGGIYGLGPFTGDVLTSFGSIADREDQIRGDRCGVYRGSRAPRASALTAPPGIAQVAQCTRPDAFAPSVVNTGPGDGVSDLHKVTLLGDDAICNDGTRAVMFVRRARTPALESRWIIHLKGGGSCQDADECLERWCHEQAPGYSAGIMSTRWTGATVNGFGLFQRADESPMDVVDTNPFADWNNVTLHYCSSDSWAGRASDVAMQTTAGLSYSIHFRGHSILEAAVAQLRAGVVSDDCAESMPPMAAGELVVLSGSSAGGVGVARNLDWLADQLGPDGVTVVGIIDAWFLPRRDLLLDQLGPGLADDAAAVMDANHEASHARLTGMFDAILDDSCLALRPDPVACGDLGVVQQNHITTPFMVFSNLADKNQSGHYNRAGVPDIAYATAIYETLAALPALPASALEGGAMTRAPGALASACTQHTTLMSNSWFHRSQVNGVTRREALARWLGGAPLLELETVAQANQNCEAEESTGE